ncbi:MULTISPECIES: glutathione peroxidase [Paenibacillus]|jgi:glutathione peroxidase|uniref:Glutathione peroxidase n=2 Tax=Paenibacillus TaxID=44249 RepID=A0A1R0Y5L7_9BACL|nr:MULTISPECIES: glutathione peroxidase [Paenibacillus]MBY3619515.1 glutathione peroxidase [Acinetobacter sp. CUI P1]AIQ22428.1 glutathione peroxidase [Paenibacillus sp. FSL H7-0737]AIQ34189.1 glutathione peroxidase [Paenibacillus sp. FSL R5-0345]KAA1187527.1 glutathione peroxidase [Paenibacillus sp. B2(2019)]OMD42650.1 glutathione peroxidase [Paenibacillus odorifer]
MSIYDFEVNTLRGAEESLSKYKGKVLLVVNTASKCGFTPQYKGLQEVYEKFKDRGFEVLGFPSNQFAGQEPGESDEIAEYCEINYGVTFPMFEKIDVKGDEAHPLFKYLSKEAPGVLGSKSVKWNFTKFLVDQEGRVLKRFAPKTTPQQIESYISKLLK